MAETTPEIDAPEGDVLDLVAYCKGGGRSEAYGQVHGERPIGESANPVGAEKSGYGA